MGLKYTHFRTDNQQGPIVYQSDYTQYLAFTYNGRKCKKKKKRIYMCITESLCYTPETNTKLQITYISLKEFFLNGQKTLIDIFPKKIYRRPIGTWTYSTLLIIQEMQIKPECDITSHLTEWLALEDHKQQMLTRIRR